MISITDTRISQSDKPFAAASAPVSLVCDQDFNLLSASDHFRLRPDELQWENLGFSATSQILLRTCIKQSLSEGFVTRTFDEQDAPIAGLCCIKCFKSESANGAWVTITMTACSDLEREIDDLKASNLELEKYAYNASHDLQEPLNNVTSYLHLMRLQAGDEMDDRLKEYVSNALNATGNMKTLVKNLLEYSKVGNQKLNWESTSLSDLLAPVILLLDGQIRATGATIKLNDNKTFKCDRFHFSILLQNLLSNALKFVEEGVKPKIELDLVENSDHYEFSISDNGIGIPESRHQDIFKTFKRLDGNAASGHGLGMAIVKRVVEKHAGQISLESEQGKGTVFFFTLPKK